MTSYVKSTNFASKDSLASGNPLKIIKGTEFDIEFNNIATAIDSKADTTSPVFAGTPTAPTAASGTNTTQLATTAFATSAISTAIATAIAAVKEALYPVGSIYTNAGVSTNPATLLGFGTWTAFGAGRVPVGFDAGNALFNSAEKTGGSYDATLVSHNHTGATGSENQSHTHAFSGTTSTTGAHSHSVNTATDLSTPNGTITRLGTGVNGSVSTNTVGDHAHTFSGNTAGISNNHQHGFTTDASGSSATNANVQPYITVYMWKRTA